MGTRILADARLPVGNQVLLGNSYEELGWIARRGFGVSVYVRFTKDGACVCSTDERLLYSFQSIQTGTPINTLLLDELREQTFSGHHMPVFVEFLSVFRGFTKAKFSKNTFLAVHLEEDLTDPNLLNAFLDATAWMYPQNTVIVAGEVAARYIHERYPEMPLAFRVMNASSLEDGFLTRKKVLYSWAWCEPAASQERVGAILSGAWLTNIVARLKYSGWRVAVVCNEVNDETRSVIALRPEVICTKHPSEMERHLRGLRTTMDEVRSVLRTVRGWVSAFTIRNRLSRMRRAVLLWILDQIEVKTGSLLTFHRRPLFAEGVTDSCDPLVVYPKCALVLQGALLQTHDFTLETVRIYKKFFPQADIIVSTWMGESEGYVERIREAGATVLLTAKPDYAGPFNINLQVTSAFQGIEAAKRLGAEYVVKTRTDQRIYNKNSLETMCNLLDAFPPSRDSGQSKRLIFVHGGNKYQPYHLPDVFVFGATNDMLEYWEPVLVEKTVDFANFLPEIHLASRYLRKKGHVLRWKTESMWQMHRDRFMALDWCDVELYWYKYDRYHEYMDRKSYVERVPVYDHLSFFEWFNIYHAQENKRLLPVHGLFMREFPPRPKQD